MMRTKLLASGALAGTLVLASVGSAFADGGGHFKDLAKAHFAKSAIMMLAAEGLVNGVSQTKFEPGAPITLGQLGLDADRVERDLLRLARRTDLLRQPDVDPRELQGG